MTAIGNPMMVNIKNRKAMGERKSSKKPFPKLFQGLFSSVSATRPVNFGKSFKSISPTTKSESELIILVEIWAFQMFKVIVLVSNCGLVTSTGDLLNMVF